MGHVCGMRLESEREAQLVAFAYVASAEAQARRRCDAEGLVPEQRQFERSLGVR